MINEVKMSFSYHKKYYQDDDINLDAVNELKFDNIEQSQLYLHYKSMYEFNWLKFLLIYYFILDSLLFLSEKFVILIFFVLFLFFIEYSIRMNLVLKYKAYCHGLTELPEFEPVEKCFLYYCEFVKVLFFALLPIYIYRIQLFYFE